MRSDLAIVMQLEQELLYPAVRSNLARVGALLTDDFCEVGVSGLAFGKEEVLASLRSGLDKSYPASSMQAVALSEDVVLVTYQAQKTHCGQVTRSLRSSVWVKNPSGWQMRYHQGTIAA